MTLPTGVVSNAWGRQRENEEVPSFNAVLDYQPNLTGDVATYSWSWAACMILSSYPEYRSAILLPQLNEVKKPDLVSTGNCNHHSANSGQS